MFETGAHKIQTENLILSIDEYGQWVGTNTE